MLIESTTEVKKEIEKKLSDFIKETRGEFQNPDCVFFVSWTFTNKEGRMTSILNSNSDDNLEEDEDKLRLVRIWSFLFPDMREDYLVERMWMWMVKKQKERHGLLVQFRNYNGESDEGIIHIRNDFIRSLNGRVLLNEIMNTCNNIRNKEESLDLDLKIARILRYNPSFNKKQINGIDKGFSKWVKNQQIQINLKSLFKNMYDKDDPARHPLEARKFLTMWQNFSVIFPEFSDAILRYYVPKERIDLRYALVFLYKEKIDNDKMPNEQITNDIMTQISHYLLLREPKGLNQATIFSKQNQDFLWDKVRDDKENYKLWIKSIGKNSLDNLMRIAEKLAFTTHEARPCNFAFLAGTEQIWPAIAETISLRFYDEGMVNKNVLNMKLLAQFCEANYSIFQIDGIVGLYNIKHQSLDKIVKLRYPSMEELRQVEDPISDLDDLFCWSIEKIYNGTAKTEKSFIVSTSGNGKVMIYGLRKRSMKADLLIIWDVRIGKVYEPIPQKLLKRIKEEIVKKIGIEARDNKYKKFTKAIRKISAVPGEGACLIIAANDERVSDYLATMELLKPSWLETLGLDDPQYILKAAFIMDGACLITKEKVFPRLAIYPHYENRAWGTMKNIEEKITNGNPLTVDEKIKMLELTGKGSKTHASVNVTSITEIEDTVVVISISADGPVRVWPN